MIFELNFCIWGQRNGDVIESCDNNEDNSNESVNSDNEAEDVVAVLNNTNIDKSLVKENNGHLNDSELEDEVTEKLIIEKQEGMKDSADNYTIDSSSKGCNVEVADVNTGSNRNSVELKVNWALKSLIMLD